MKGMIKKKKKKSLTYMNIIKEQGNDTTEDSGRIRTQAAQPSSRGGEEMPS